MPIYEFLCNDCHKRTSLFVKSITTHVAQICPSCGGPLSRCISGFAFHKSLKTVHEAAGDPELLPTNPDYYKDPRNIGRWAEKRFSELGVDMPSQAQEMIAAAREGEMPDSVKGID
ncbi:FmdB family zinc ribbon protein [Chloroflexota bacterium]